MKTFRVGTFVAEGSVRVHAYTTWYNRGWSGCIEYDVEAANGTEAKKVATKLRRAHEQRIRDEAIRSESQKPSGVERDEPRVLSGGRSD
jgi:hypothetical protein